MQIKRQQPTKGRRGWIAASLRDDSRFSTCRCLGLGSRGRDGSSRLGTETGNAIERDFPVSIICWYSLRRGQDLSECVYKCAIWGPLMPLWCVTYCMHITRFRKLVVVRMCRVLLVFVVGFGDVFSNGFSCYNIGTCENVWWKFSINFFSDKFFIGFFFCILCLLNCILSSWIYYIWISDGNALLAKNIS